MDDKNEDDLERDNDVERDDVLDSLVETGREYRSDPAERLRDLHDAAVDCEDMLVEVGAVYARAYVGAACGNIRRAIVSLETASAREARRSDEHGVDGHGDCERLRLVDGRSTGILLIADGDGLALRGRAAADGTFQADADADAVVTLTSSPDLGADLIACAAASELAKGDVAAALLCRALETRQWMHSRSRARWRTGRQGASTMVALLRNGRRAPALASGLIDVGIDRRIAELLGDLGWFHLSPPN